MKYIKSVNFNGGKMLNFAPSNFSNKFLYDEIEIGERYYQRPLMKITTETKCITLSFEDDAPANEMYAQLRAKLSSEQCVRFGILTSTCHSTVWHIISNKLDFSLDIRNIGYKINNISFLFIYYIIYNYLINVLKKS